MGFLPRVEQSLHRSLIPAAMATFATAPVLVSDPATVSPTTPSLSTRMCVRICRALESLDFDWWIKLTRVQYHAGVAMVLAGTGLWPNFMLRTLEMQTYVSRRSFSICSCSKDSSRTAIKCNPEDDCETLGNGNSPVKGGIVALGKFDALHIGHRELAVQASKAGPPFLLSFVGMAEVLGWEPRAPIVANCDRKRVLSSWASHCGNVAPKEFQMKFSSVRSLSPRQFVEKLVKEFGLSGVVAGENYRFGYRASGDASELVRLCNEYGIDAYIINPVMDKDQDGKNIELHNSKERGQVSSSRVRYALNNGDMGYVSKLLGRRHRLVFRLQDLETQYIGHGQTVSVPKSCLLNLPPKEGRYESCSFLVAEENPVPCTVLIDSENIHLEFDDERPHRDFSTFGVEFGA